MSEDEIQNAKLYHPLIGKPERQERDRVQDVSIKNKKFAHPRSQKATF